MPSESGEYEIRYILNQGKTVLASTPISIKEAEVSVTAPKTAAVGVTVRVNWTGPDASGDFIAVYPAGDEDARYTSYTRTRKGSPLKLLMPSSPGEYEIRYVLAQDRAILATTPISITQAEVSLSAPDTADLGTTIEVDWTGPDSSGDFIAIYPADEEDARYTAYTRTRKGSPLKLAMPAEPGDYEIRYVLNQDKTILATSAITITAGEVSVDAPDTAVAEETINVSWQGPDGSGDFIAIYPAGDESAKYTSYKRTKSNNPLTLKMPAEPGEYEIRYVLNQGKTILARHTITVTEEGWSLK
jgi:Ca-activated chloride channel family protein